jgi:hypothetical protein
MNLRWVQIYQPPSDATKKEKINDYKIYENMSIIEYLRVFVKHQKV